MQTISPSFSLSDSVRDNSNLTVPNPPLPITIFYENSCASYKGLLGYQSDSDAKHFHFLWLSISIYKK